MKVYHDYGNVWHVFQGDSGEKKEPHGVSPLQSQVQESTRVAITDNPLIGHVTLARTTSRVPVSLHLA